MVGYKKYQEYFRDLSVKITNGQRMPNKAVMLISIMDLIRCGYIKNNKILLDDTIEESFEFFWRRYFNAFAPKCWTPFWHLKTEPFWHFKPKISLGDIESLTKPGETATLNAMRSAIRYAYLDDELFEYLHDDNKFNTLKNILLETYIRCY